MADTDTRVAVYLDFDNIVMSWYDRVHGRNSYSKDRARIAEDPTDPEIAEKLQRATIDVGAVIDYAASFGTLVLTRAYADWSLPVNADYRQQLVARAVDLVQLFPGAAYAKNGADIRLAVDAIEDMFRLDDLTHVVIVGGDSDYVPLAQRVRRLGRHVVGVGVAGSTAKSLAAACDEFDSYETLPGVVVPEKPKKAPAKTAAKAEQQKPDAGDEADAAPKADEKPRRRRKKPVDEPEPEIDPAESATRLLQRALELGGRDNNDDAEWLHSSAVKQHMRRMDPSFSEKALGFRSFNAFLKSREDIAELSESGHERLVRPKE